MSSSMTLEELVSRIYEKKTKFYKLGYAYLFTQFDIEDAMQNTIIKAYENIKKLKDENKLDIWITSIFVNECKMIIRKNKKKAFLSEEKEAFHNEIVKLEDNILIEELLNKVDKEYRDILVLKYICGYSYEEIGEILKLPQGTVKSRCFRALKKIGGENNGV